MWGVVFAFASVWCPEPSPAATDDRPRTRPNCSETVQAVRNEFSTFFFLETTSSIAGRIAESAKPPVRAGKLMCRVFGAFFFGLHIHTIRPRMRSWRGRVSRRRARARRHKYYFGRP